MTEQTSRRFDGDSADAAIDRAVREIMSGEPRPGFRQRVLSRLDEEPRTVWSWPRLSLAASAAVAIVVMLAIWGRPERTVAPIVTAPPQARQVQPTESTPPLPPSAPPKRERRDLVRIAPPPPADRRVSAASVSPAEEALEPGAAAPRPPIDPMAIAPLQVRPLETPELIVRPVAVGPLVIVPILPPR